MYKNNKIINDEDTVNRLQIINTEFSNKKNVSMHRELINAFKQKIMNCGFFFVLICSSTKRTRQNKLQASKLRRIQSKQRPICDFSSQRRNVIQTSGSVFGGEN